MATTKAERNRSKTRQPRQARQAVLQAKALKLRTEGYGYDQIAARLKVSAGTAHNYVRLALEELAAAKPESTEALRAVEAERLDLYLRKLLARVNKGDIPAIATALKVAERRARLFGLDGAQRIEVSLLDMLNQLQTEE